MSSETANTEAKRSGMMPLFAVALATLLAGGGVGAFVVGPMVAGGGEAAAAGGGHGEEAAEDEGGGHGAKKGGHGEPAGSDSHNIENLVVNPAGTQGTRFLIVSLALVPGDSKTKDQLTAHDAEIRDTLIQVLSSKTVQELSDLTQRERVKEEMRTAAEAIVKPGKIRQIFMPQFVLQ